jgi:hypothetical protein
LHSVATNGGHDVITGLRRFSESNWVLIALCALALMPDIIPLGLVRALARYLLVGYVPGLAIWKCTRQTSSSIVDIVLYPSLLSILPFAWIALAGVFLGLDLRIASAVAIAVFVVITLAVRRSQPAQLTRSELIMVAVGVLVSILLLIIPFIANSFQAVAWDASLHAAIVSRILAGVVPPDSPMMAGQPANYYWLYHFYSAALIRVTGLSAYQVFAILNVHALILFILVGYRIASRLTTNFFGRVSSVWMLVFGLNAFGWVIFAAGSSANPERWYSLVAPFAMVKDYSPSLGSLIHEFLDGSPFALAFAFNIAWLDFVLARMEGERSIGFLFTGALILATLFYLYPLSAVFVVSGSLAALGILILINRTARNEWRALLFDFVAIMLVAAVVTAPYAWNILHAKTGAPFSIDLSPDYLKSQAYSMAVTVGLIAIVAAPALWLARRDKERAVGILGLFALVILIVGLISHVALEAEYKFIYLLVFGLAPLVAIAWNFWRQTVVTRAIFFLALVICVPTNVLTSYCFMVQPPRETRDPSRLRLLGWIRDKTPPNAVLVEYPWWEKYQTSASAYFYLDRFWFDIGVYGNRRQLIGYTAPMLEQWGYRDIELRQDLARKLIKGERLAPTDVSYLAGLRAPIIVVTDVSFAGGNEFDPAVYVPVYEDGALRAYRVVLAES